MSTSVQIWPAVDVAGGQVVRLVRGDFATKRQYADDPFEFVMQRFDRAPTRLHLVDLSGVISGEFGLFHLIEKFAAKGTEIQAGGGFRTLDAIAQAVDCGARRIVIGSLLIKNANFRQNALSRFPNHLVAGLDVDGTRLRLSGWREEGPEAKPFWFQLLDEGWTRAQITDIQQDGGLRGIRESFWSDWACVPGEIGAGGGITTMEDLGQLEALGISHAVVGKAWIEGHISIEEMK